MKISFVYSAIMAVVRKGIPSDGMILMFCESYRDAKMARFNFTWLTEGRYWKEFLPEN